MSYPYLIQGNGIVVVIDNKVHSINKSHPMYKGVREAIIASEWDTLREIIEPKKALMTYGKGNLSMMDDDTFYWKGKLWDNTMAERMLSMVKEGFDIDPMVNFMENLMENPDEASIKELYLFMESCDLPITPDGHLLAFKNVGENYMDIYSRTMDNSVGKILEMERKEVDPNRRNTCSNGLHFCSLGYLPQFPGKHTMILKINPRDIVAIPADYNNQKGRTCRYEVIGELNGTPIESFTKPVQENANNCRVVEKVVGLSMTKNAIRKRAARAAKKLSLCN